MSLINIKAVLVDDEPNALHNLAILLEEFCPNVSILGKAMNVDEAVAIINKVKPDLVFLDIEMPQKSGFELFNETPENFKTIFVTAYNKYAIRAFEVSALDYLLKPIDIDRLQQAVAKVTVKEQSTASIKTLQKNINSKEIEHINVLKNGSYRILNIKSIISIEADGPYTVITYDEGEFYKKYTHTKSLGVLEKLFLDNNNMIRVHRSWLINMSKVTMYTPQTAELTIGYGIKVPVSRNNLKKVKESFNLKTLSKKNKK